MRFLVETKKEKGYWNELRWWLINTNNYQSSQSSGDFEKFEYAIFFANILANCTLDKRHNNNHNNNNHPIPERGVVGIAMAKYPPFSTL